jgi:SAM-dependent methyltransferase
LTHPRETYDALAAGYVAELEASPFVALYEQPALRALVPPVGGRAVLDAGCGAGRYSRWLTDQGATVTGLDASPEMLRLAEARVPEATFAVADLGEPLALPDDAFDVAVAGLVLHYLRDWAPTLRELHRVLKPGGSLVFSVHHPATAIALEGAAEYFATELVVDRWTVAGREHVVRFWRRPLTDMFRALTDNGFAVERLVEPYPLPECRERFPDVWEQLTHRPEFLVTCARAR